MDGVYLEEHTRGRRKGAFAEPIISATEKVEPRKRFRFSISAGSENDCVYDIDIILASAHTAIAFR